MSDIIEQMNQEVDRDEVRMLLAEIDQLTKERDQLAAKLNDAYSTLDDFKCFKCGDDNTPLYCPNCAREGWLSPEKKKVLVEALELLMDLQNGPPLLKYKEAWESAMDGAKQALEGAAR